MKRLDADILEFYDTSVIRMICEKYGYDFFTALRSFIFSKTYKMLENEEQGFYSFGAGAVFDIWEAEKVTGDPRNSVYIRGE